MSEVPVYSELRIANIGFKLELGKVFRRAHNLDAQFGDGGAPRGVTLSPPEGFPLFQHESDSGIP
jgi:hypothetical protein